jgi:hypothetical protein
MGHLHVLIQTLINISYRRIQLLSTSTYLPLAKVGRLYYIGRYSGFTRFTPLLTHQLSCRSPQNSAKVQIKGTTQYSKNKHINSSSNIFYLLSRQLPLTFTSKGNASLHLCDVFQQGNQAWGRGRACGPLTFSI